MKSRKLLSIILPLCIVFIFCSCSSSRAKTIDAILSDPIIEGNQHTFGYFLKVFSEDDEDRISWRTEQNVEDYTDFICIVENTAKAAGRSYGTCIFSFRRDNKVYYSANVENIAQDLRFSELILAKERRIGLYNIAFPDLDNIEVSKKEDLIAVISSLFELYL